MSHGSFLFLSKFKERGYIPITHIKRCAKPLLCFLMIFLIFLSSLAVGTAPKTKAIAGVDDLLWYYLMNSLGLGTVAAVAGVNADNASSDGYRNLNDFEQRSRTPDVSLSPDDYDYSSLTMDEILSNAKLTQQVMLRNGDRTPAFKVQVGIDDYLYFLNDMYKDVADIQSTTFEFDYDFPVPTVLQNKWEQMGVLDRMKLHPQYVWGRVFVFDADTMLLIRVYYVPSTCASPKINVYPESDDYRYYFLTNCYTESYYPNAFSEWAYSYDVLSDSFDMLYYGSISTSRKFIEEHVCLDMLADTELNDIVVRTDFPPTLNTTSFTDPNLVASAEQFLAPSDRDEIAALREQLELLQAQGLANITTVVYPEQDNLDESLLPSLWSIPPELANKDALKVTISDGKVDASTVVGDAGSDSGSDSKPEDGILGWLQGLWDWLTTQFWNVFNSIKSTVSSIGTWCQDFWNILCDTLVGLFVPSADYWDDKPTPASLIESKFPVLNQVESIVTNAIKVDTAPLILSFKWFDIDTIYNYPNPGKTRTYTVDFSWYNNYKDYVRGGLTVLFWLLALLGILRIVGGVFGVGVNSAVHVAVRNERGGGSR